MLRDSFPNGGAERQLALLAESLPPGVDVCVWGLGGGPFVSVLRGLGVPVELSERRWRFSPSPVAGLWRLVRSWRPDVLHTWGWMSAAAALPVAAALRVPVVDGTIRNATINRRFVLPRRAAMRGARLIVANSRAGLRTFSDELFPLTVAATDGLAAVVLDYVPRWEPVRCRAFVDWLRRGGTLHLLPAGGEYPRFGGELSILNTPTDRVRVGSGLVVRHRAVRGDVTREFLAKAGCPLPESPPASPGFQTLDESLLAGLKEIVRPEHEWTLIYLGLIAYLILIGPVNYLIGRRAARYRLAIGFFLCAAMAATWAMGTLGRRGFGEVSCVHSLAYAVPIDSGHYDVTQWVNVFVTHGDEYAIRHAAEHNLYAACETHEAVSGMIQASGGGRFHVDIPRFSNRPFLHRARLDGPPLDLEVREWTQQSRLEALTLSTGEEFAQDVVRAWVLHKDTLYPLRRDGSALRLGGGRRERVSQFVMERTADLRTFQHPYQRPQTVEPREAAEELAPALIVRAIGDGNEPGGWNTSSPEDEDAQLFVLAESPPGFGVRAEGLGSETGFVLYHVRLHRPENTDE